MSVDSVGASGSAARPAVAALRAEWESRAALAGWKMDSRLAAFVERCIATAEAMLTPEDIQSLGAALETPSITLDRRTLFDLFVRHRGLVGSACMADDDHSRAAWSAVDEMEQAAAAALEAGPSPLTAAALAAALDDVLETTAWEGRGASLASAVFAALKSRGVRGESLPPPEKPNA